MAKAKDKRIKHFRDGKKALNLQRAQEKSKKTQRRTVTWKPRERVKKGMIHSVRLCRSPYLRASVGGGTETPEGILSKKELNSSK